MKIRAAVSVMIFSGMLALAGCMELELESLFPTLGGWPSNTGNSYDEWSLVEPGFIYADSAVYVGQDSMKLYGHFRSHVNFNRKASIEVVVFELTNDWGDMVTDTVARHVEWNLHGIDTTIFFMMRIPAMDVPTNIYLTMRMVVNNNLPGQHGLEQYLYNSSSTTIRQFTPVTYAYTDSVSFLKSGKAVLWAHLETKLAGEIVYAGFEWNRINTAPVYDTIMAPGNLMVNKILSLRDTIEVEPDVMYAWRFFSVLKFKQDSLGEVKTRPATFIKYK